MKPHTKNQSTKSANTTQAKSLAYSHKLTVQPFIDRVMQAGTAVIKTIAASLFFAVAALFFAYIIGGFLGVFGILPYAVAIKGMERLLMYPVTFVCMATVGFFFLLVGIDLVRNTGERHSGSLQSNNKGWHKSRTGGE